VERDPFAPLWRGLAIFRLAALCYAVLLQVVTDQGFARPAVVWATLAVMAAWTAYIGLVFLRERTTPLLLADVAVCGACVYATRIALDAPLTTLNTIPTVWAGGCVLACALSKGLPGGALAAVAIAAVDLATRGGPTAPGLNALALLLLAGGLVGYARNLVAQSATRMAEAAQLAAATQERERLARSIHDSVLQVLALVARDGATLGPEAAKLARLAGDQEAALRAIVTAPPASPDGEADLTSLLHRYSSSRVSVAAPAGPVPLPVPVATEVAAAVGAALDNVRAHAGPAARSWVLVEDEPAAVTVTVRDDGVGMAPDRLAAARAEGQLGIAESIDGRVRALGGEVTVRSAPGTGVTVRLRVPRA